jgi:hypothetical protein
MWGKYSTAIHYLYQMRKSWFSIYRTIEHIIADPEATTGADAFGRSSRFPEPCFDQIFK